MKKRFLTLKILLALSLLGLLVFAPMAMAGVSTGNGIWEWVRPTVQGNNINAMSFIDASNGWAVGGGGSVMKTTNGGTNWTVQTPSAFATPAYTCHGTNIGSGCALRGVSFISASVGWAVGDYASIWKTSDGGTTWTDQHINITPAFSPPYDTSPPTFRAVHFFDANNGVTVGDGFTFYTSNGGATWAKGNGTGTSNLSSVQMLNTTTAVAVGSSGVVYKTINGGVNWTAKTSNTTANLSAVAFSGSSNGYAVGGDASGRILRTTDGGETWTPNTASGPISTVLTSVALPGGTNLVTTGSGGNIRKNAVNIWADPIDTVASGLAAMTSGTSNMMISASFAPGSATGYVGGAAGLVLASTDSGSTWSPKNGGDALSNFSSSFVTDLNGWTVGENGTVNHTTNGGGSWSSDNAGIASNVALHGVNFRNASLGFAVGVILGSPNVAKAYKYNSGTWSEMDLVTPGGASYLSSVKMSDDTNGFAVGEEGVIMQTADGTTWTKSVPSATYSLNSVDTTASTNGWAVGSAPCPTGCATGQGSKGIILKYSGGNWNSPATIKTNVNFFTSIDMVDATYGWAVGYNSYSSGGSTVTTGRVYKTTDGGLTWTEQTSPTSKLIAGVTMLNTTTGYLVADEGRIGKYNGLAGTWSIESSGTDVPLYNVAFGQNGPNYAFYAAGGNGAILKFAPVATDPDFIAKWDSLGGLPGTAVDVAHVITGGKYQDFSNGRLIWNSAMGPASPTTVWWVHGAIQTKYEALGGTTGAFGFPTSDEGPAPGVSGAVESSFTGGRIYWGPGVGAYGVSGAIGTKFTSGGGSATYGIPTGDEFNASGGKAQNLQKAIITWDGNGANPAYAVVGGILAKYRTTGGVPGGPLGSLGLATTDEQDVAGVAGARESRFTGGRIFWGPGVGTYAITRMDFLNMFDANSGSAYLGIPTSDSFSAWDGFGQNFQKAIFTWNPRDHEHFVRGGVMVKYQMTGGPAGYLHLIISEEAPLSPALPAHADAVAAVFENGRVYWSGTTGSHIVNGGVYVTYLSVGGPQGRLGLPITDEYPLALPGGGARSRFEHGFITWWALYGTWVDYI
ncbi:MAG: YCF48-related protein [Thermoleophilia bacterium]|nr:YCF48-related protein [Thermoleophilia bacterium]